MNRIYKNKRELIKNLIQNSDTVLDVGFWGQGVGIKHNNWVHKLLLEQAKEVHGLDVDFDLSKLPDADKYRKGNAENFDFGVKFDVIFAGDLIEHLSNPGLFLTACRKNLKHGGRLIITTPNCFSLFSLSEKIMKSEPTTNPDHTCYFNSRTLRQLLSKNQWQVVETSFLYSLDVEYKESYRKKFLNVIYYILSKFTSKFVETLIVVAKTSEI